MATKKYLFLLAAFFSFQQISFSQSATSNLDWGWNYLRDSSKIPNSRKPQFNEFLNNSYPFPARPRDMWELGVGVGGAVMSGDLKNDLGVGFTVTARKSLSHVFSVRPFYSYYSISGAANTASGVAGIAKDYKNYTHQFGIDFAMSLNTLNHYRGNPKTTVYALAGLSFISSRVDVKDPVTGKYVAFVPNSNISNNLIGVGTNNGKKTDMMTLGFDLGLGIARKLNDRINIAIEAKNTLTNFDYFDGFSSQFSNAFDAFWFTSARINFNLGSSAKRVQPLWWLNPANYAYNELNSPNHMKMPKVKLDDADGDGITDQFDKEPNTPAGAAVDSRGRALDTDGDGVPDYKDKELLTPQKCFPVDNDGVGTCPESPCCKTNREKLEKLEKDIADGTIKVSGGAGGAGGACSISNLPSIVFKTGARLTADNKKLLDAVAAQMKANPACKVKVVGHPVADKPSQQRAYDRVDAIIKYLVEKQAVAENRFIFAYDGGSGDANTIDLMGTTEEGPNTVPAPHPNLRGRQNY